MVWCKSRKGCISRTGSYNYYKNQVVMPRSSSSFFSSFFYFFSGYFDGHKNTHKILFSCDWSQVLALPSDYPKSTCIFCFYTPPLTIKSAAKVEQLQEFSIQHCPTEKLRRHKDSVK